MKERLFGSVLTETLLEFGALEDLVEHVVKSPLVVGHHVSTFFLYLTSSQVKVKKKRKRPYPLVS